MNKEYKEVRKQVAGVLLLLLKNMEVGGGMFPATKIPDIRNKGRLQKWASDILALETDTCRIAVVKKNAEIPRDTWFWKNCQQQRRKPAKICLECPFIDCKTGSLKNWVQEVNDV